MMLDKFAPHVRHLLLLLLAGALTWAGTDLVPFLKEQEGIAQVAGVAVTMLIAWLTPLTRQYGVGSTSEG